MQYIKFGFGRALRDASRLIRNGHLDREKGLKYVKEYDGEFPEKNFQEVLEYLNLDTANFHEIIDKHRNSEIWEKTGNNFKLKINIK